jgi:hypothetical protein
MSNLTIPIKVKVIHNVPNTFLTNVAECNTTLDLKP